MMIVMLPLSTGIILSSIHDRNDNDNYKENIDREVITILDANDRNDIKKYSQPFFRLIKIFLWIPAAAIEFHTILSQITSRCGW